MKKELKKKINSIYFIGIVILLILIIILISSPTGKIIKEQKKQVQFRFYDEVSNCSLNGYVFIGEKAVGKSYDGIFNLSYENYFKNFKENEEISIFGELGSCFNSPELYFDEYWNFPEIKKYYFSGESVFDFKANITQHNPSKRELMGFIHPENVNKELKNINIQEDNLDDLSRINLYLNNKIRYVKDWNFEDVNYWQTPVETLNLKKGDCEDYSTTLLSLFLSYNNSLNCYNVVFNSHVTTFCYVGSYYVYYDQGKTELKKQIKTESELKELKEDYFEYYGIDSENRAYYAFNDNTFVEFSDEEDFIMWQYNLKEGRQEFNLFLNIENQITENTKNFSEILDNGELATQTVFSKDSKIHPFLIMGLFIIIIILIYVLIKINRG